VCPACVIYAKDKVVEMWPEDAANRIGIVLAVKGDAALVNWPEMEPGYGELIKQDILKVVERPGP